ncbi:nicotinamide riboside transporter PnuC [Massilia sp. TS11]|uniref:nicotinamide riboside transporter PnuC n=1 Tax=Massilia sp. TS11 TaxID=2908003 RepID=UPI001EDAB5D2|nr:nicotinamide riboside transporter PnuC [Massilia sp. TS11]MCG2583272.1 nicotinamide riboside transporter PnuC [Massilia sp. TS11]
MDALNASIVLLGFATTPLELVAFVLALATVALNIRQVHWAWLFAILSSLLYGVVFYDARLYGDMGLQGVFAAVSVWGWYQWLRGGPQQDTLPVSALDRRGMALSVGAWLLGYVLLAAFLARFTNTDVPHIDGFLTAGSLVGQVLLSRKKIENWHTWIVVDVLYVGLYVYKHLALTAILYGVFVVLAVAGLRAWRKELPQ